jgi:peptidyl-tRNA hydrolase
MEVAKWATAFALGMAGHWYYSVHHHHQLPFTSTHANQNPRRHPDDPFTIMNTKTSHKKEDAEDISDSADEGDERDSVKWEPHKMVLVVRNDLKMGKGKIAAQCCHATLGAYKRAVRRTPLALECWEALGQAKVALKVDTEEELLLLATRAKELGLVHYVVVDAGRTQIAPDTKTVLAVGPASVADVDNLTGHLKLL